MKDTDGQPLSTTASVTAAWEHKFLQEFAGRGDVLTDEQLHEKLERYERERAPLQEDAVPSQLELVSIMADQVASLRNGKALGPDAIPA